MAFPICCLAGYLNSSRIHNHLVRCKKAHFRHLPVFVIANCYLVPCPRVSYTTAQEKHEENNSMGYSMHPSHDGGIESSHEKLSVPCPCLRHPALPPTDPQSSVAHSAERKWACQWPTRPSVPFWRKRSDAKMPVGGSPTVARQWIRSGTSKTPVRLYAPDLVLNRF